METNLHPLLKKLNKLPFKEEILNRGGMIFAVGGIVRDAFLNKESKDFDIMVTGIESDTLIKILTSHGKVDLVGESFGILKFKEFGHTEDIDISLPRVEINNGDKGHKAFDVSTDPFLPIESDLSRRDIKINSMAIDIHGNIIDPFDGFKDLENEVISMTNVDTFFEDPLRMLRAIGFASRFKFKIEPETFTLIKENTSRIKEISPERILIELEKIVSKGKPEIGAELLIESGLFKEIFGSGSFIFSTSLKKVKTLGEFIFLLHKFKHSHADSVEDFFKNDLKGDVKTCKEIKALCVLQNFKHHSARPNLMRRTFFDAMKIFPEVINTKIFDGVLFDSIFLDFEEGKYPKSLKELDFTGHDLMELGFVNQEIGDQINDILDAIFNDGIHNKHNQIKWFCSLK